MYSKLEETNSESLYEFQTHDSMRSDKENIVQNGVTAKPIRIKERVSDMIWIMILKGKF